jgi:hypothetical protein
MAAEKFQHYCAFLEEGPMTLQIAAICETGWMIASDRRQQHGRMQSMTTKLFTDKFLSVTYATFGNGEIALIAAEELKRELRGNNLPLNNPQQLQTCLVGLGERIWQRAFDEIKSEEISPDPLLQGLTIFFHGDPTAFWVLQIGRDSVAQAFEDSWPRGDFANPAMCFWGKYYSSALTPHQLAYLAAHVICIAPYWNRSGIAGLNVTLCTKIDDKYKVEELSKSELKVIKERSEKLDRSLYAHFGW